MNYIFTCSNIISFLIKAQVKDKNDVHAKKEDRKDTYTKGKDNKDEIIPMDNTAKLSYRDVLVKGSNKELEDYRKRRQQHEQAVDELLYKAVEALSLLPPTVIQGTYNIDDLPDVPQVKMTEEEVDRLIWKVSCRAYKGTKAGDYFNKAYEMLERGF